MSFDLISIAEMFTDRSAPCPLVGLAEIAHAVLTDTEVTGPISLPEVA